MHRFVFHRCAGRLGVSLIVMLLLTLGVTSVHAQPLKSTYTLLDGGQTRTFEIAVDEVHVRSTNSVLALRVDGLAQPDAVRLHAELLSTTTGKETELVLYEAGAARGQATRRVLTKQVLVRLAPGMAAGPALGYPVLRYVPPAAAYQGKCPKKAG